MKICFFAGANSSHSHRWIKYFAARGHEVHWISLSSSVEPPCVNYFYNIGPLSRNPMKIFFQMLAFRKLLSKISPDILHIHSVGTYGLVGISSGFHPLVVTAWGSDVLFSIKSIVRRPLVSYVLKMADMITCDAKHMKRAIVELGAGETKIRLIHFGVEPNVFAPSKKNEQLLESWEVKDEAVIISLRNLEPIYDVKTLISAIPYVLKYRPGVRFIVGGTGSQFEALRDLSVKLNVADNVRFIGRYSHDNLPDYLNSSDIYVSTSLSDAGIAASTAEAMACALPVIVTDSGENKDWVMDMREGFVVPVGDPVALAEKILVLLNNETLRKACGKNARDRILLENDYFQEMFKMNELYSSLMGRKCHYQS